MGGGGGRGEGAERGRGGEAGDSILSAPNAVVEQARVERGQVVPLLGWDGDGHTGVVLDHFWYGAPSSPGVGAAARGNDVQGCPRAAQVPAHGRRLELHADLVKSLLLQPLHLLLDLLATAAELAGL